jgi:DNA-binding NarL/FixJ family response regulator
MLENETRAIAETTRQEEQWSRPIRTHCGKKSRVHWLSTWHGGWNLEEKDEIKQLESTLTPREREVLRLLVDRKKVRIVAQLLGSSCNTVLVQRASIMKKMRADNIADPVRLTNLIETPE